MAIGGDIREVLEEVGTLVQIEGTSTTEYIDYDFNVQVGNPFLREHMRNASFPHDTAISPGDILFVPNNGERLLVVNHIPEMFENSIVTINSTLYICNIFGKIFREEAEDTEGMSMHQRANRKMVWNEIGETYAVFTSSLRGNTSQIMDRQDFADLLVKQNILYFPNNVDIRTKDRFWVDASEYYTVGNVEKRRFNQCSVADLTEDMRHSNYAVV